MPQQTTTIITSNNETFTIGTYNGFEIMIRDKDKYVNATKLVQLINERENTNKQIHNINRSPMYKEFKNFIQQRGVGEIYRYPLEYNLPSTFVNEIMDAINENNQQTHMPFEDNKDRLIEQLQTENINQRNTIQDDEPRLVPKGRQFEYIYSVVHVNDDIDGNSFKVHRLLKRSAKCYPHLREQSKLFIDNLPVAATINYEIKHRLKQRNIIMKNLSFTIPKDQNVEDIMELIGQTVRDTAEH
ncbi:MAG: hypothetical protein EZS28_035581 [Streblomastix strix]|uniref:Uncharacterized protein n=1 Tax=Streblomastix strix TaxID=222440 RepID=A0A5J4UFR2_9EUKA|nr:MAG: hypothetical protein EZS28_035581 [Streblomastix strix]